MVHIRIGDDRIKLNLRLENQTSIMFEVESDENFISYFKENKPDIAVIYGDHQLARSTLYLLGDIINQYSKQIVVMYARESIEDITLVELVENARFSIYL